VTCAMDMAVAAAELVPGTPGMDDVDMVACVNVVSDLRI